MPKNLLIVGHTRSGGHFLMNSISKNFDYYVHHHKGRDMCKKANRSEVKRVVTEFNDTNEIQITRQQVWSFDGCQRQLRDKFLILYIVRDGRDVVGSLFDMHTKGNRWTKFKTFEEFLRNPFSTVSFEHRINIRRAKNPIDSWLIHQKGWRRFLSPDDNVIYYEDLYYRFERTIKKIADILQMQPNKILDKPPKEFNCVMPRKGCPGQWRDIFSEEDLAFYNNYVLTHKLSPN